LIEGARLASRVGNCHSHREFLGATPCFTSFLQIEGNSNPFCPYPFSQARDSPWAQNRPEVAPANSGLLLCSGVNVLMWIAGLAQANRSYRPSSSAKPPATSTLTK